MNEAAPSGSGFGLGDGPRVSVIMANWRGERFLGEAIASVLSQSLRDLELLVVDDASDDRSQDIVREAMDRDPRVRLLAGSSNAGPSDARNRGLAAARGEWVAIVDSDDLLHPRRLELLLTAAGRFKADIVADDLAFFGDSPVVAGQTLFGALALKGGMAVSPVFFLESGKDRTRPSLGYVKPLIRRSALAGLGYDPAIRIGEDYDLYLRLLLRGLRLVLVPLPLYQYRRHSTSLSHRTPVGALNPVIASHDALVAALPGAHAELLRALALRRRLLHRSLRFEELVAEIKAGAHARAAGMILREPFLVGRLLRSVAERVARRRQRPGAEQAASFRVVLAPKGSKQPRPAEDKPGATEVVLEVPPLSLDRLDLAPDLVALSCRLTDLSARGHVEVIALGPDGLDALGLLPRWRSAQVWLTRDQAAALPGPLPANARLKQIESTTAGMEQEVTEDRDFGKSSFEGLFEESGALRRP